MRKMLATALLLGVLGGAQLARADDPLVLTGTISIGNPAQAAGEGGITENAAPCKPAAAENGLDGVWFSVAGREGDNAVLNLPDPLSDVDVAFYTANCTKLADTSMGQNFIALGAGPFRENTERGKIPLDAAFAIANGFFGANIAFTLTITDPV